MRPPRPALGLAPCVCAECPNRGFAALTDFTLVYWDLLCRGEGGCVRKALGTHAAATSYRPLGALGKLLNLPGSCLSHLYTGRLQPGLNGLF